MPLALAQPQTHAREHDAQAAQGEHHGNTIRRMVTMASGRRLTYKVTVFNRIIFSPSSAYLSDCTLVLCPVAREKEVVSKPHVPSHYWQKDGLLLYQTFTPLII